MLLYHRYCMRLARQWVVPIQAIHQLKYVPTRQELHQVSNLLVRYELEHNGIEAHYIVHDHQLHMLYLLSSRNQVHCRDRPLDCNNSTGNNQLHRMLPRNDVLRLYD